MSFKQFFNEGPIYVDPNDTRAGNLSDYMGQDVGRGGDSDFGKAIKYGKIGREDEHETIQRINRVAVAIYNTLKAEQDTRVQAGEEAVSPEKWSNLKLRLIQLAREEGLPSTKAKFFMRVIVNTLRVAGIIQVNVKTDKVMVDVASGDQAEDIETIEQGVEQAEAEWLAKAEELPEKGFLGKLFSKFK